MVERPANNLIGLGKNSGQVNGTRGLVLAAVTPSADATMVTDTALSVGTADSTVTTTAGGLDRSQERGRCAADCCWCNV